MELDDDDMEKISRISSKCIATIEETDTADVIVLGFVDAAVRVIMSPATGSRTAVEAVGILRVILEDMELTEEAAANEKKKTGAQWH